MGKYLERAQLLWTQERYDLAEAQLREELAIEPNNAVAHALLAKALACRGAFDEAIQAAQEAVRLQPDMGFAYQSYARVLHQKQCLREAEANYLEAIRLDPHDPYSYDEVAHIQTRQQRYAESLMTAERGLQVRADDVGCMNSRAAALVYLGRAAEGKVVLEAALAREPVNARTLGNLGWVHDYLGNADTALAFDREALRVDPTLAWVRTNMLYVLKDQARKAAQSAKTGRALQFAQEALRLQPDDQELRDSLMQTIISPLRTPLQWLLIGALAILILGIWIPTCRTFPRLAADPHFHRVMIAWLLPFLILLLPEVKTNCLSHLRLCYWQLGRALLKPEQRTEAFWLPGTCLVLIALAESLLWVRT